MFTPANIILSLFADLHLVPIFSPTLFSGSFKVQNNLIKIKKKKRKKKKKKRRRRV